MVIACKILVIVIGLILLYLGALMYPDERKRLHSKLESLWIVFYGHQVRTSSKIHGFFKKLATYVYVRHVRLLGDHTNSWDAKLILLHISVALSATIGALILPLMMMIESPGYIGLGPGYKFLIFNFIFQAVIVVFAPFSYHLILSHIGRIGFGAMLFIGGFANMKLIASILLPGAHFTLQFLFWATTATLVLVYIVNLTSATLVRYLYFRIATSKTLITACIDFIIGGILVFLISIFFPILYLTYALYASDYMLPLDIAKSFIYFLIAFTTFSMSLVFVLPFLTYIVLAILVFFDFVLISFANRIIYNVQERFPALNRWWLITSGTTLLSMGLFGETILKTLKRGIM